AFSVPIVRIADHSPAIANGSHGQDFTGLALDLPARHRAGLPNLSSNHERTSRIVSLRTSGAVTQCPAATFLYRLLARSVPHRSNIGSCDVSGGKIVSYAPFTIRIGILTRPRKFAALISGSAPKNVAIPPDSSTAVLIRLSDASRIGATSPPQL